MPAFHVLRLFFSSFILFFCQTVKVSSFPTTLNNSNNSNVKKLHLQTPRRLQSLFMYTPTTPISDQAAIDLDKQEIENQLIQAAYDNEGAVHLLNAWDVYRYGANSKPYAHVELSSPLYYTTTAGAPVIGLNTLGQEISGATVFQQAEAGIEVVSILYPIGNNCQVGASRTPKFDGCFAVQGEIVIGNNEPIQYSYDISFDNHNDRTIRKFSVNAGTEIFQCNDYTENPQRNHCPNAVILDFFNYYERFDYGDVWITSALHGKETKFESLANVDFSLLSNVGRAQAAGSGMVYMNVWMYVIGKLNNAIHSCFAFCNNNGDSTNCETNRERIMHSWDEAVAFYTGSLQHENPADGTGFGGSDGYLLYQLANDRCMNYYTCGESGGEPIGEAKANYNIFKLFIQGQESLSSGNCEEMLGIQEQIVPSMILPLVQGLLRMAYMIGELAIRSEEVEAEGATFAAALVPLVHKCSPEDSNIIFTNMKVWGRQHDEAIPLADFPAVKQALERNYNCLGLTCERVGGLVDIDPLFFNVAGGASTISESRTYLTHAEPCNDGPANASSSNREHAATTTTSTSIPPHSTSTTPVRVPEPTRSPHRENHNLYVAGEFSIEAQVGICVGLFLSMLCVTLLSCLSWRVSSPIVDCDNNNNNPY